MNKLFIFFLLFVTPFLALGEDLGHSQLLVQPEKVLMGLPPEFTVLVTNFGDTAVKLPPHVISRITNDRGEVTLVDRAQSSIPYVDEILEAGKNARITLPMLPALEGNPFVPFDLQPGRYRVELLFFRNPVRIDPALPFNAQLDPSGAAFSVKAGFEVVAPTGRDAEAWNGLLARNDGKTFRSVLPDRQADLATWLWSEYPDSKYAPYVVLRRWPASDADALQAIERAIAQLPRTSHVRDLLSLAFAEGLAGAATRIVHDRDDVASAAKLTQRALEVLESLVTSANREVQVKAQNQLKALPTRELLENRAADNGTY